MCNSCSCTEDLPQKFSVYTKPSGENAKRPIREQAYMMHAMQMAELATCDRLKVGAVFTDAKMMRVLCSGYNGSYAGGPNGCDSNEPGNCGCIHAEVNSLVKSRDDLQGSICFVTVSPCEQCSKILVNRGVSRVIYLNSYRKSTGLDILRSSGIEVIKYVDL